MNHRSRTILRCTGLAILVLGVLALVPSTVQAQDHVTGLSISKSCPTDPIDQGQCGTCTFTATNLDTQHSVDNLTFTNEFPFNSGNFTTSDCLQGGVPTTILGPAGSATDSCGGSFVECAPITCSDAEALLVDEVRGEGTDAGPAPFTGLPATGSTTNVIRAAPLTCPAAPECNVSSCVPGPSPCGTPEECDGPGVGCILTPAQDSTPCGTDEDTTDCAEPGCLAGTCSQTHIPVADSTPCGTDTDGNECTAPGCLAGVCEQAHIPVAESTPCGTDTDGNDCTAPGCTAAGECSQIHILDAPSTPCGTDADTTDCTTPGCTAAGECSQTHNTVADSTPCGTDADTSDCAEPGCLAGVCDQTHIPVAASSPCGEDTDGLACTTPGCTEAGTCSQTHIEDCGVEICRTPGFWGTHGGTEKSGSVNITQALLDAYNGANDPDLTICGQTITNTDVGSVNSALEAICVSPKGNQLLQLARQLTSAALNCIITNSDEPNGEACPGAGLTGAVCASVSIGDIFDACNAACEAGETSATVDSEVISCVGALDCFNNGGSFEFDDILGEFVCAEVEDSCHDRPLEQGCFDFAPPGSAGSSGACNDARKNDVNILP